MISGENVGAGSRVPRFPLIDAAHGPYVGRS